MNPYAINPPESDVVFEELCLAILKRHWKRPGLERFAKKGEEQFGVDIFDTLGETPMYAAQCKLKEPSKSLEPAEIIEEVRKAEGFPTEINHYALMTTGKVSGQAQLAIQTINQKHRASGSFTVELFTWDKISKLIREYPEIEEHFFGGFRPREVAEFKTSLEAIHTAITISSSASDASVVSEIDGLIDEARERIKLGETQIAVMLLNKILRQKGDQLSSWHRFRILTNLGAANLITGKGKEASRYFLDAAPLRPDDELAVANEVLAYHLLLDDSETRQKAALATNRFPHSARIRSLYLQSAPATKAYSELLDDTPEYLRAEGEVASALARRAMMEGHIEVAIGHARASTVDKPAWPDSHLLLAQTNFARVILAEKTVRPLMPAERQHRLNEASKAADEAIATATTEDQAYVRAQAYALKADIAHLLRNKDDLARFARAAYAADPSELHGQLALAQAAVSQNNHDEAIQILEQALQASKNSANVSFMLGQALMVRGSDQDLVRAIDVFSATDVDNIVQELIDPITIGAVRAIVRSKRLDRLPAYLDRKEVVKAPSLRLALEAFSLLSQESSSLATDKLDAALAARQETDSHAAADFLARALLEAGRNTDALPMLQHLFDSQAINFDVGLLLSCASRLGDDQVILETCQALYDRGIRDWEFQEFEVQYLEEYDPPKAISRLEEFVQQHPEHAVAKLRLAIVDMRFGKGSQHQLSPNVLPTPELLPMRYAVATIHALQWQGRETFAVDYAYRVLRANPEEFEAHRAYLASLMPGAKPEVPAVLEEVVVNAAVQYSESGLNESEWVVIEKTQTPNALFEEIASDDALALELYGKHVGDTFVLARSPIKNRVATITQILTKYTRRYQAIGDRMEIKFPEQTVIRTMRMSKPDSLTAEDMQPILDSVTKQAEATTRIRDLYRNQPVPIAMYGELTGHSAYEALFDLAVSETSFIRCAHPQMDTLVDAMSTLTTKNTVVLDLTALATLRLLLITRQILTSGVARFVLTPGTSTALKQLHAKSRFATAHGTMGYEDGQHYFTQTTQEQSDRERASFEEWMLCVQENTVISPVPEVAAIERGRRDTLEKLFGRDGLESAVLALAPGSVLWTDDLVLAESAKQEFGTERIWSQAAIESIANRGLLNRSTADECHAKLLGFGYQATHFTGGTIVAALRAANGAVDAFPMKQATEAFNAVLQNDRVIALRQLIEFVMTLSLEPMLPETKCLAIEGLLNCFPTDPDTMTQLRFFRDRCVSLLNLNVVEQGRFNGCFNQWVAKRRIIRPLV